MPPQPVNPAKPTAKDAFSPWNYSDKGLVPAMIEHLKAFTPEGNPDPVQLENAKALAIAEVKAVDGTRNMVRVTIEANSNPNGRQVNVIVISEIIRA